MLPPQHRLRSSPAFKNAVRKGRKKGSRTVVVHLYDALGAWKETNPKDGAKPALQTLQAPQTLQGTPVNRAQSSAEVDNAGKAKEKPTNPGKNITAQGEVHAAGNEKDTVTGAARASAYKKKRPAAQNRNSAITLPRQGEPKKRGEQGEEPVVTWGGPQIGAVVSKAVGNSVVRHTVARKIRAAMAGILAHPGGLELKKEYIVVIRALPACAHASTREVEKDVRACLRRITDNTPTQR